MKIMKKEITMIESVETEDKDEKLPAMKSSLSITENIRSLFIALFHHGFFFQNDYQGMQIDEEEIENEIENDIESDIEQKLISEFGPTESRGGQEGGTMLILYCIPAIILSVLIVLAWRSFRGKIRVKLSSTFIYIK